MIPVAVAFMLFAATSAVGPTSTTVFSAPGTKTVTLKVCAQGGACSTVTKTLTVLDPAPRIISVNVPALVSTSQGTVPVTAQGLGKPPLNFRWTLTSPSAPTQVQTTPSWTWTPALPGTYQLTFTLSNLFGSASTRKTVDVRPTVFADVAPDFWGSDAVETLRFAGITAGCGADAAGRALFCPSAPVSRAELAVLLGVPTYHRPPFAPRPATGLFQDVPASHWAAAWIEQLYRDGLMSGCQTSGASRLFCPAGPASRAEVAVVLETARHPGFLPPPYAGIFVDVPASHWAAPWIERLYRDGISTGCSTSGPLRFFCPDSTLTRAELAVFLVQAFGLVEKPSAVSFLANLCSSTSCTYPKGMPIDFGVRISGGIPTFYDYDWAGDGVFEETVAFPVPHTFAAPGTYTPRLRIRRGSWSMTITHPYPIVIFNPSLFSLASPSASSFRPRQSSSPPRPIPRAPRPGRPS
jgi:PKD repeat protein